MVYLGAGKRRCGMGHPGDAALSEAGGTAVEAYARHLREHEDLAAPTLRNYLSDLRHFAAWCEVSWGEGTEELQAFDPASA